MNASPDLDLSVVIPAYNEEKRLGMTLEKIGRFFERRPERWEAIVSDDGSSDGTVRVAEETARTVPHIRVLRPGAHAGKGAAVKAGALAARGRWVLVTDADLAAPIEEYDRLKGVIETGADGVVGSRILKDPDRPVRRIWIREWSSRFYNRLARRLLLPGGVLDIHCGFKLFKREVLQDLVRDQMLPGFGFDLEILYLARRRGYRIRETPIAWTAQPGSKVNPFREPFVLVGDIFRVKKIHG